MCQRPALQQDYWMTPFHEWPQTIKRLNPVYTEDWMELITSSSAYPGPTIPLSHIGRTAHTPGLYCSPSIQTPRQTWPHRRLAASLDEWKCLLQILWNWWSLFFLQIKVSTSSVIIKNKTYKFHNKTTPLTGWTEIFFHLVDTEKHETQHASVLGLISRRLSWY